MCSISVKPTVDFGVPVFVFLFYCVASSPNLHKRGSVDTYVQLSMSIYRRITEPSTCNCLFRHEIVPMLLNLRKFGKHLLRGNNCL